MNEKTIVVMNNDTVDRTWCGQTILVGDSYTLQAVEINTWINNEQVKADIASGKLIVIQQPDAVIIQSLPEPAPFAQPTYRTKMDAIPNIVSIEPNTTSNIDFLMSSEKYVSGGELVIENAEFGDYVVARVQDIDGVIPSQYRASCENWPIVNTYIEKSFVSVKMPGTLQQGAITCSKIDTYPLNAKISAGLYLRIEYHAVSSGLTRKVALNYFLTKKL